MGMNKRQQGFTLIELLLYVALSGVILLAVSLFFSLVLSVRTKAQSVAEVEQQGTLALQSVLQTIRNASAVTSPSAGATSSSLTLAVPAAAKSPTVIDVSGGVLRIKEGAGSSIALTDSRVSTTDLVFSNLSGAAARGSIRIQFNLGISHASATNEYNYAQNFIGSATLR